MRVVVASLRSSSLRGRGWLLSVSPGSKTCQACWRRKWRPLRDTVRYGASMSICAMQRDIGPIPSSLSGWLGGLAHGPDEDLVDLHAGRLVDRPEDGAGDVVGLQRAGWA